jgi:hypothetical protein
MLQPLETVISDQARLGDLTVGEFKALVRALLSDALNEFGQDLSDPDAGLSLRPDIQASLARALDETPSGIGLAAMKAELGLLDE